MPLDFLRSYALGPDHPGKIRLLMHLLQTHALRQRTLHLEGGVFDVDRSDLIGRHLWMYGAWEPITTASLVTETRDADVFIDIGAHIGYFSITATNKAPNIRTYSFEANPSTYASLVRNIALNLADRITPILGCVSSAKTFLRMQDPTPGNSGTTAFVTRVAANIAATTYAAHTWSELVKVCNLEHAAKVVVKIDIEGGEFELISDILQNDSQGRVKTIFFEYNRVEENWSIKGRALIEWARRNGFACLTACGTEWDPANIPTEDNLMLRRA